MRLSSSVSGTGGYKKPAQYYEDRDRCTEISDVCRVEARSCRSYKRWQSFVQGWPRRQSTKIFFIVRQVVDTVALVVEMRCQTDLLRFLSRHRMPVKLSRPRASRGGIDARVQLYAATTVFVSKMCLLQISMLMKDNSCARQMQSIEPWFPSCPGLGG